MNTTKKKILKAGVKIWPDVTYQAVADKIELTKQAVNLHFPQGTLKDNVADYAVKSGRSKVIVQLIATDHPAVGKMSPFDRAKHLNRL